MCHYLEHNLITTDFTYNDFTFNSEKVYKNLQVEELESKYCCYGSHYKQTYYKLCHSV